MKRILIIDRLFSHILPRKMKSKDCKIICVQTLEDALEQTRKHTYNGIICEMDFLATNNKEILDNDEKVEIFAGRERIIFNFIKKTNCRVILNSGYNEKDILSKLKELKIEDRVKPIQIPVSTEIIESEIENFFEGRISLDFRGFF